MAIIGTTSPELSQLYCQPVKYIVASLWPVTELTGVVFADLFYGEPANARSLRSTASILRVVQHAFEADAQRRRDRRQAQRDCSAVVVRAWALQSDAVGIITEGFDA
jgi:hypothetical protein